MPVQAKDVLQTGQNKKKKSTQPIAEALGSQPNSDALSLEKCLSAELHPPGPPKVQWAEKQGRLQFISPYSVKDLAGAFGTNDKDSITQLLKQVLRTLPESDISNPNYWNYFVATVYDIAPKDALERLLSVQMVGVHQVAMEFLARAAQGGQTLAGADANTNRAVKLLRTFVAQMESLNRHRGNITQPMVVGNVNIADGGQAIVGPVNHPGPGKVSKDNGKEKAG